MEQEPTQIAPKQLIITADDVGLSEGINQAAHQLFCDGILTTVTMLMNFEATEHAMQLLGASPGLKAGVHLNLTDGYPLTDVPDGIGLTLSDGHFQPRTLLFPRSLFPSDDWKTAAEAEMKAQIEAFIAQRDQLPNHLTTHMHFHIMPSLREMVFRLADNYGIPWVRVYQTSSTIIPYNFWVQQPDQLFQPDNDNMTPDYLTSVQAWLTQDPSFLVKTLRSLTGMTEIVVHPSIEVDDTYPIEMSHPPQARFVEVGYIRQVVDLLREDEANFVISDPADDTPRHA